MLAPGHTQTQWMRLLVGTLRQAGVRQFVVSPGSRSTPIVAALQHAGLALHTCIDERSAGFLALGMAKATGAPVALVCTSGTAGAHYYPALIEASHSELPLLVLTADRPGELQENGAAQTIDQSHLYGRYVRLFFDLGSPDARVGALRGLRRKLCQAVAWTCGPHRGPVHLNVPAFKPLEPREPSSGEEHEHALLVAQLLDSPLTYVPASSLALDEAALDEVSNRWRQALRPVLFCGPSLCNADARAIAAFARRLGWPVLAELTSPVRRLLRGSELSCDAFELLARARVTDVLPDLVVQVGSTATSSAWYDWLVEGNCTLAAISAHRYADPLNRLSTLLRGDVARTLDALAPRLPGAEQHWLARWRQASDAARRVTRHHSSSRSAANSLRETDVAACLGKYLRDGDALILGNSLPIRVAETFFETDVDYRCFSQRGTNGIDGLIAGAAGTALMSRGRSFLLLGDVSAVHDLGALPLVAQLRPSLVLCIIDNGGGRIFDDLPISRVAVDLSPWTTPHQVDLAAVSRALGLHTSSVRSRSELSTALDNLPAQGPSVILCHVEPLGSKQTYVELTASLRRELES